jgi:hypothetical protein
MPPRPLLAALLVLSLAGACGRRDGAPAPPDASEPAASEAPSRAPAAAALHSGLAVLEPLVGRYPHETHLWQQEPLAGRLHALLGSDLPAFLGNMEVVGPLSEEDGLLYVVGNKQHRGGTDAAAIVMDLHRDAIWVWLLRDGKGEIRVERDADVPLPEDVRITLANAEADGEP